MYFLCISSTFETCNLQISTFPIMGFIMTSMIMTEIVYTCMYMPQNVSTRNSNHIEP